ncbi:uncharacterized protein LOC108957935 [Eucalyptus grandis]|uniref:uncharacterized protein LOC108957935 n=1 Tax=Eucalyptus grandis TaxID=71139 RepID=UPI00192EF65E|nr:uncharacterized protein LOC108957935 [Eucalyptus grandis]
MRGEDFGRPSDCFVQNRFKSYRGYCNLVEGLLQKLQNASKLLIGSWCLQLCCIHVYMEGGVGESKRSRRIGGAASKKLSKPFLSTHFLPIGQFAARLYWSASLGKSSIGMVSLHPSPLKEQAINQ